MESANWDLLLRMLGILVSGIGLFYVARNLKRSTLQQQSVVFIEYTKRFSEILKNHSDVPEILAKSKLSDADKKRLNEYYYSYTSLIHQEFALLENSFVNPKIWAIWLKYFEQDAAHPQYKEFWESRKERYEVHKDFYEFVEKIIDRHHGTQTRATNLALRKIRTNLDDRLKLIERQRFKN